MRIAVLSDIHGNVRALEKVLRDLREASPDAVVNLGDHVSGPLEARLTAELLMDQSEWIQIRGNHDRRIAQDRVEMRISDESADAQLTDRCRAWLASLPATATVEGIFLCHGTPADDNVYLLERVSPGIASIARYPEIAAACGDLRFEVLLCGHSHVPRFIRRPDGVLFGNPGSVGLQAYYDSDHAIPHAIENGSPHARYMLLDRTAQGSWRATFRTVEYDWASAAEVALRGGRPEWASALVSGYA